MTTTEDIIRMIPPAIAKIMPLSIDEKVEVLNAIRRHLHWVSPFDDPVDLVTWIESSRVIANNYNPNKVAPPEMRLLALSIIEDGYTQPIVTYLDEEAGQYIVVDGFHRGRVGSEVLEIRKRLYGYLPVVVIDKDPGERMASTVRHNRARGTHDVDLMSDLVAELHRVGKSDTWIAKHLGMDADEVLRLKQIGGLADLFRDKDFSLAWDVCDGGNE